MKGRTGLTLLLVALAAADPAPAQRTVSAEALLDLEAWKTDSASRLLAVNGGDPAWEARLHGWLSWRATATVELVALGLGEAGTSGYAGTGEAGFDWEAELELLALRWTPSRFARVELGKVLLPMGSFGQRHFSAVNPLIGAPDMYPTEYPWGALVGVARGPVDGLLGLVSLPAVNTRYTPEPAHRLRPVAGAGARLGPAVRLGVSATHGPYLGGDHADRLPRGTAWTDFTQTVVGGEARVSLDRAELRGEVAWSAYDVPTHAEPLHGLGWYAEARVTLTPRIFVAGRYEHYRYPFVLPVDTSFWVGNETTQRNGEVGVGYRLGPALVVKSSLRLDDWPRPHPPGIAFRNGYAFAVQLSWRSYLGAVTY